MKHLELHILQSFPVVCLNRDDLNSPKTAIFGGAQRARVSSQSWKRAVRERAQEISPGRFKGERTRLIVEPLRKALVAAGLAEDKALDQAKKLTDELVTLDKEAEKKGDFKSKTLFFSTPAELIELARAFKEHGDAKKAAKAVLKEKGPELLKDGADIALFGRMVAHDHSLTLEGAAMFAHALSTHRVDNEMDFFSAVDDKQPKEESGAGMTGTLEFNSATYYRFAALNIDLLKDGDHLGVLSEGDRRDVVRTFVEATLTAVPIARRNSMNGDVLPGYVLGIVRGSGHPVQFVNAFERPVRINGAGGLFQASEDALKEEHKRLNHEWGLKKRELASVTIPGKTLSEFLDELTTYVD